MLYTVTDDLRQLTKEISDTSRSISKLPQTQAKKIIVENLEKTVQSDLVCQEEKIGPVKYRKAINYILSDLIYQDHLNIEHILPMYRLLWVDQNISRDIYPKIQSLLDQYHTDEYILSPFILSAIFHYTIIKEDIFPEYNRAFARLFSFLVLLRGKYDKSIYFSLEEKITKSRGNYEKSIDHVRNGKDATPAIKFFLHLLFSSLTDTTERFQQEQQMKDIYKDMLDFVQKNKLSQFAAKDIKPFVKKDMRTVRRYLKEMCDIKLIEKHGDKKGTYYTVLAH